ncbi:MAG: DNA repair protein RadC [Stagnimonas sp.]|nr:DNA repair protein RadC [Stagnimonas sp.]
MSGIKDWPEDERPREKLLLRGTACLSDAELLAIFLRTGIAGRSAVDLARDLLQEFGSLRALLKASQADFSRAKGLGPAKYAQLQAVLELARRHLAEELPERDVLNEPSAMRRYLVARLREEPQEVFLGLFLDAQLKLIASEELARGSISAAQVYPREVVKVALRLGASAVVFAHNHPSGHPQPSLQDKLLTERLKAALATVDVRLIDHFVVGESEPVSLAAMGWV